MRALRAYNSADVPKLELVDVPKAGFQDIIIKVAAVGLAPGFFKLLKAGKISPLPVTVGHEVSGTVAEVGELVDTVQVGQRVRLHPNVSCGSCNYCCTDRDQMCAEGGMMGFTRFGRALSPLFEKYHEGGMSDYIRAPSWLVDVLPDNVSFELGAKVHDMANALRALKEAKLPPGSTVIVLGATGTMGSSAVKLAKFFGIGRLLLVGRSASRLEAVKKLASTDIICDTIALGDLGDDWPTTKALVQRLRELSPREADAILDFWPKGADIWQAMGALATNGTLVHMGGSPQVLPYPMALVSINCWRIIGTRNNTRADARTVLQWLQDGHLKAEDLITHRYKLEHIDKALATLEDRSLPMWMAIVNP